MSNGILEFTAIAGSRESNFKVSFSMRQADILLKQGGGGIRIKYLMEHSQALSLLWHFL